MSDHRAAFADFVDLFYTQKRVADAFALLVSDDYRQHNPNIADGPDAAIAALTPKFDDSPDAASTCSALSSTAISRWCTSAPRCPALR